MENDFIAAREAVLAEVSEALRRIDPGEAEAFIAALTKADQIFAVGVGRVGLSLSAMVKRLNHIGFRAWMVGDLSEPAATPDDLLIIGSGSGESAIPAAIARVAREKGARIAYIGSNPDSSAGRLADVKVRIPVRTKLNLPDEMASEQIMSSLFEQTLLLFADAAALAYSRNRGLNLKDLWNRHANLE